MTDTEIVNLILKCFICLYWVVLIGHNIYNYGKMSSDAQKRNWWIKTLILVNFIVILLTGVIIFLE